MDSIDFAAALAGLTARVEALEKELALLKGEPVMVGANADPIDLDFDVAPLYEDEPEAVHVAKDIPQAESTVQKDNAEVIENAASLRPNVPEPIIIEPDNASAPEPEMDNAKLSGVPTEPETDDAKLSEVPTEATANAPKVEETEEDMPESFMDLFGEESEVPAPKPKRGRPARDINEAEASKTTGKAIMDVMADRQAWYHDMPGSPVKSLRSAIGLGDQVLFIRRLFREDSALYQDTIERINGMTTLDAAIKYLTATFPEWKMDSEDVYRFMMAVRRKIR